MTRVFSSFLAVFGAASSGIAGTVGTPESERARLEDELAEARNALDALVLQPGMRLDDPRVREKSALVEEKTKAFRKAFESDMKGPAPPAFYPNKTPDRANGEREEPYEPSDAPPVSATGPAFSPSATAPAAAATATDTPPEPATALSAEGVQAEIRYSKKPKPGKSERPIPRKTPRFESVAEPVPAETAVPDASGLSEIQYPKKKKP